MIEFDDKIMNFRPRIDARRRKGDRHRTDSRLAVNLPFRFWDGEGQTFGDKHLYILLANSDGEWIENEGGLSTESCFEFLTRPRVKAKNVWFAFGYDIAKIVNDIPLYEPSRKAKDWEPGSLDELWRHGYTYWRGWQIRYIPRKMFHVKRKDNPKWSFASTDAFSFFQCSFLDACEEWGIDASQIVEGKAARGQFSEWSIGRIRTYNDEELRLGVLLMDKLRAAFVRANLQLRQWHGPGAVAAVWLKKEGLSFHLPEYLPHQFPDRYAYFGGRADTAYLGELTCHEYDITSAYPHALTDCISLLPIRWLYSTDASKDDRHAIYHVSWDTSRMKDVLWNPFPWRNKDGYILYPPYGQGWYHGIEVLAAERAFPGCIDRLAAWYPHGERFFPFATAIQRDFAKRLEVGKRSGTGHAYKLILNSIYGKLAQKRSGFNVWKNEAPRFQCYTWAGYVTAYTRARMLDMIAKAGQRNVISIATDGIFTRRKLTIPLSDDLGGWEYAGRGTILLIGSGLYAVFRKGEVETFKARGMPGGLNYGWILRQWGCSTTLNTPGECKSEAADHRFIGIGHALQGQDGFGTYKDTTREIHNGIFDSGSVKRIPHPEAFMRHIEGDMWREFKLMPVADRDGEEAEKLSYEYNWREYITDTQEDDEE